MNFAEFSAQWVKRKHSTKKKQENIQNGESKTTETVCYYLS